jgi:hypothetical protein
MTTELKLSLDDFSRQALGRIAQRDHGSTAKAVETASLYYLAQRDSPRPAWDVPRFARGADPTQTLEVELHDSTWQALSEEADEQGVTPEMLAIHAILYFLADLDSGRLTDLLDESFDSREGPPFRR